jgi:hypothetical protein
MYHPPSYPCLSAHKIRSLTRTSNFCLSLLTLQGTSNTAHPSLPSNFLFICCSYMFIPSLGTNSCRVYNYHKISLVFLCLIILKLDSFSDFPKAAFSSAQTNNGTAHSPATKKHARTHIHRSTKLLSGRGILSCLFQSHVSESADI